MKFLESNELLCKEQHGFRSGRSCLTNLLEALENWTQALDEGYRLDVVYSTTIRHSTAYHIEGWLRSGRHLELDLVCRKRAVSNSRPACWKAFFEVYSITFLLATVSLCCSAYMPRQFRTESSRPSHACIVSKRLNLSAKFFHCLTRERVSEIWSPHLKPYWSN